MQIHREGYHIITWLFILAGLLTTLIWQFLGNKFVSISATALIWVGWLFIVRFFRSPDRLVVDKPNTVFSPADGLVVSVQQETEPEYFQQATNKISIFMSGNDIHINWVPFSGRVVYFKYHPGKNLFARRPKSSELNERTSIVIEKTPDQSILVRQIAGFMA
ncbi:MAG: phosphatidylserine decarboxylase, partial [Bacteroidales bacterium]|nr:phosphatidylserine decarboxylase [Bacteroidales bacterium]